MNTFNLSRSRQILGQLIDSYGHYSFLDYENEDPTTRALMRVLEYAGEAREALENFCSEQGIE